MNAAPARIPRGPRSVLATALCAVATCAAVTALSHLIEPGRWLTVTWLAVGLTAAVVAGARAVTRSWWAPTLVGLVVAAAGVLVRYGAPPGRIQVLPDLGSLDRAMATAREGVAVINASLVPMPGVRPAELLVVVGAVLVLLVADLLAVGLGLPALAGIALLGLWVPTVFLGFPGGTGAVAWTGLAYLLLLALSAAPASAHSDRARRTGSALAGAAAVVVTALAAGPVVAALPGWASLALPSLGSGPVGPLQLSSNLDLRESLGTRSGQVVLRYTVVPPEGADAAAGTAPDLEVPTPAPSASDGPAVTARLIGPLRAFTLTSFDGREWQRDDATDVRTWEPGELLASDPGIRGGTPDAARGTLASVAVEVGALRERRLPVSTFPRTVTVDGAWSYDDGRDEVVGRRSTFDGMRYSMLVEVPDLTADDLAGARVGDPGDAGASLAVPTTEHAAEIEDLARSLTADATTPYEQAMALQSYFRAATNFTYDTRVAPARSEDAVWDFLQSRRGYCVQFATGMALMARTLDIPARVGVGFLPGDADGDGTYVVTGRKSHAWPELYFADQGWVRFEPTPAIQSGAPPLWSDPFAAIGPGDDVPDEALPSAAAPTGAATTAPVPTGPVVEQETEQSWTRVGVIGGVVLVALLLALPLVRRRTRTRADETPERAWLRARRRLASKGISWSDATTPRDAVLAVQSQVLAASGSELDAAAARALQQLARTVERQRYAPAPEDVATEDLLRWTDEVVDGVTSQLSGAGSGRPTR
ncbi:transglutaminaseTgpA domain-containing protein [Cellulomonas fimi]|uniref:transglutaminase family protein n=2 Tax=Cellulomonas fimi TaxID=1708 RepID=UPI000F6E630E|nr:transglutaminase domain-containing protein [Cellulomonas fimi]VEH30445.1 Uncharacterized protein involved in cytokinesis, contains TGc (transglutaminase/protease-like) domain [Cellulomonas fimi]